MPCASLSGSRSIMVPPVQREVWRPSLGSVLNFRALPLLR